MGSWLWKEPLSPLGKSTVLGLLGGATVPALPPRGLPVSCCARGLPGGSGAEALGILLRVTPGGRRKGRIVLGVQLEGAEAAGAGREWGSSKEFSF